MEYQIINLTNKDKVNRAIALGFFDGLHKGHQRLIFECLNFSNECITSLLTFDKSPNKREKMLLSHEEKIELLRQKHLDEIIVVNFDKVRNWTCEQFVEFLINELKVKYIFCGNNFHFAKDAKGDVDTLKRLVNNRAKIYIVPQVLVNKSKVSTSKIIDLLSLGKIKQANSRLGYNYFIKGIVEKGHNIGSKYLFPTANLHYDEKLIIPKNGVYSMLVEIDKKSYLAVANIGYNPTINHDKKINIEIHLLEFSGNLYGRQIKCYPLKYLREEIQFANMNDLRKQIKKDIQKTKKMTKF